MRWKREGEEDEEEKQREFTEATMKNRHYHLSVISAVSLSKTLAVKMSKILVSLLL